MVYIIENFKTNYCNRSCKYQINDYVSMFVAPLLSYILQWGINLYLQNVFSEILCRLRHTADSFAQLNNCFSSFFITKRIMTHKSNRPSVVVHTGDGGGWTCHFLSDISNRFTIPTVVKHSFRFVVVRDYCIQKWKKFYSKNIYIYIPFKCKFLCPTRYYY